MIFGGELKGKGKRKRREKWREIGMKDRDGKGERRKLGKEHEEK